MLYTIAMQLWERIEPGIRFYCHHLVRIITFLGSLFGKSPFFVTKDDVEKVGLDHVCC